MHAALPSQGVFGGAIRVVAPGCPWVDADLANHVQERSVAAEGHRIVAVEGQVGNLIAGSCELFLKRAAAQREHLASLEDAAQIRDDGRLGLAVEVRADLAPIENRSRLR